MYHFTEERKRKSPEESPADVISPANVSSAPAEKPSVTTSKKFKADNGSSVAKEGPKLPRPARKSSRNASKGKFMLTPAGRHDCKVDYCFFVLFFFFLFTSCFLSYVCRT